MGRVLSLSCLAALLGCGASHDVMPQLQPVERTARAPLEAAGDPFAARQRVTGNERCDRLFTRLDALLQRIEQSPAMDAYLDSPAVIELRRVITRLDERGCDYPPTGAVCKNLFDALESAVVAVQQSDAYSAVLDMSEVSEASRVVSQAEAGKCFVD